MKVILTGLSLSLLLGGCTSALQTLSSTGVSLNDIGSAYKVGSSVTKSMEDITPEQEYYIGRSISANLLSRYKPYNNKAVQEYINQIGLLVSYASDKPDIFGGYHFMVLDSDEINAFAAPGGFIFVTRGMLRCTDSEDAVAAILAHEIAHVTHQHGMQSIKKSRWSDVGMTLGSEAAKKYTSSEVSSLVSMFEGSIDDVVNTLVVNGYSREYEEEADESAIAMLNKIGYSSSALIDVLKLMDKRLKPGGLDFAKTHPDPKDRISEIGSDTKKSANQESRFSRYRQKLAKI
ncbi:MAG: M48 family metalloprotease [Campylobacterota bacterium]|nr:M48 family metalloprotease [Campylobacterota bacterium]